MPNAIAIERLAGADAPRRCEPIIRSVPEWFGIEEATRGYIEATAHLPTWVARLGGRDAGFLTIAQQFPAGAEVHCIAVHRDVHGRGVGTALLGTVEDELRGSGVRFLQVKTLGPSRPNANYARTKHFYERCGFVPLEEIHGLWPGNPCLIMIKSL